MPAPTYLLTYRERRARERASEPDGTGAPLYRRRFAAGARRSPAWRHATASPEIVPSSPVPAGLAPVDLHLLRHGETQSYVADAGLTPRGEWQSRRYGHTLSAEVQDGEAVRVLCAPTARAARTADQVRLGLEEGLEARGLRAAVHGPEPAPAFRNFQIWTPSGLEDPTRAAGEHRLAPARQGRDGSGRPALWLLELSRYWSLQAGGGDAIEFWLTHPLLTFEPPAAVVRRFWAAALGLAGGNGRTRVVCCTHSGPMRAFAAWALGHDAGEPYNAEEVRVRVWPDAGRAAVTYRGRTQELTGPPAPDGTAWWDAPARAAEQG